MSIDPYATPVLHAQPPAIYSNAAISQGVIRQLAKTKPWVRFISVLMFIGAGLMLLGGAVMMLAGGAVLKGANLGAYGAGMGAGIAVFYAIFAIFYIYPALKLWKYASRIAVLINSGQDLDLETALNEQRAFWKFIGIVMLSVLVLYALVIMVVMISAVFAASQA